MCHRKTLALRILLALALLGAFVARYGTTSAFAQQAQRPLEGRYELVAEKSDDVEAAIEQGTGEMNFIKRPIARRRLKQTNATYKQVAITSSDSVVAVSFDRHDPVIAPATGQPTEWTREDGERMRVRAAWLDGALRQTFITEDGQRENLFSLAADGDTLRMRVTVTSGQLPAPVVYTLVYRRVESAPPPED